MTAFSNLPLQAMLPLASYDLVELRRAIERSGQRLLEADCASCHDGPAVCAAIATGFALAKPFGTDLQALLACLIALSPGDADPPGFVVLLHHLPEGPGYSRQDREALLDVFRDAGDHFFDADVAFRVFYSVSRASEIPA
jgi:hypothetical protein